MKLKIAVNKSCKNKTNPQKVAKGWLNINEDVQSLEPKVSKQPINNQPVSTTML